MQQQTDDSSSGEKLKQSLSPAKDRKPNLPCSLLAAAGITGNPSSLPSVSRWTRASLVTSYAVLVTVELLVANGILVESVAIHDQSLSTPLTPRRGVILIWAVILVLQGFAVVDQALPSGYGDSWRSHVVQTIAIPWQIGWLSEAVCQAVLGRPWAVRVWIALASLLVAAAAFGSAMLELYGLRRKYALGPPSLQLYCMYLASTAINTAWVSFRAADGVLVASKALGASAATVEGLSVCLITAASAVAVWVVSKKKSTSYGLTVIWILVAVYSNQKRAMTGAICLLLMLIVGLATILSVVRKRQAPPDRDARLGPRDTSPLGKPGMEQC
uniref:Uncharacterized protein n=1 Tax=Tetraselmis sp. GSL018 TaxID=582737 RepID=A0A061S164_9CHLO|mmetsp:Transcript_838/g.2014  ORF Transcript_838/g.2014 Transcript_838/m.2014 type:complete len:329 (+) Transcript_838:75-1061(+)